MMWYGMDVHVLEILPFVHKPDHEENVLRAVKHSAPHVYAYIGEDVGPLPEENTYTHVLRNGNRLYVSQEMYDNMIDRIKSINSHGKLN